MLIFFPFGRKAVLEADLTCVRFALDEMSLVELKESRRNLVVDFPVGDSGDGLLALRPKLLSAGLIWDTELRGLSRKPEEVGLAR